MSYAEIVKPRTPKTPTKKAVKSTPQTKPAAANQVPNSAGGYTFKVDIWTQLERFLIIGTSAPTYYATAEKLTLDNAGVVVECAAADPVRTVATIVEISDKGRAFKNDSALFALAVVAELGGVVARKLAFEYLNSVARIPTHLFDFNSNLNALGGKWNKTRRTAIGNWYNNRTLSDMAYQMVKYQNRNGWTHRDLLRLAHVTPTGSNHAAAFQWATKGIVNEFTPEIITVYEAMKAAKTIEQVAQLVADNKLTWEFVPSEWLGKPEVWDVLLPNLPPTALIRNLARMTANGLLKPNGKATKYVVDQLRNRDWMAKARVHPFSCLVAQRTYQSGQGSKGSLTWLPVPTITSALEDAFYAGFNYTEPTGQRYLWAADVSGSMGSPAGDLPMTCAEVGAAMALTLVKTEDQVFPMAFAHDFRALGITAKSTLDQATGAARNMNFGSTDCALPMVWAQQNKIEVDTFIVFTDNETWAGRPHPHQALEAYRQAMGIPARLIVAAATPTPFSIANPSDAGMLDIVGADTNLPKLIADFSAGNI